MIMNSNVRNGKEKAKENDKKLGGTFEKEQRPVG